MSKTSLSVDKEKLADVLREYGVSNVAVFGSFARGDAGPSSDLDLLVTYKPGTTLFDAISLQEQLEEMLGRRVDLVSRKYLSERLARRISKDLRPLSSLV